MARFLRSSPLARRFCGKIETFAKTRAAQPTANKLLWAAPKSCLHRANRLRQAVLCQHQILRLLFIALFVPYSPTYSQSLTDDFVKVEVLQRDNRQDVLIQNLAMFDATITLEMDLDNLLPSTGLPLTTTLQGKQDTIAFHLSLIDKSRSGSYATRYYFVMGNRDAVHDTAHAYHLPYRDGSRYRVVQGHFGNTSHDETSAYAVDFAMRTGTPVCAARGGFVVGLFAGWPAGGPNEAHAKRVNYILIRHRDRTLGAYYHLKQNGVRVRLGQKVERGQVIALSGNSGFSFAPHLHFEVLKALDGRRTTSLPTKFSTAQGVIANPVNGNFYTAK